MFEVSVAMTGHTDLTVSGEKLQQGAAANVVSKQSRRKEKPNIQIATPITKGNNMQIGERTVTRVRQHPVRTGVSANRGQAEAPKTEKPSGPGGRAHTGSRDLSAKAPG